MNKLFVLLLMIFFHIVDDYYLQGILASMKQKSWWEKNAPQKEYENDYKWALAMHAFSWSFMVMLPIAYITSFQTNLMFVGTLIANTIIHALVDNGKANEQIFNLIEDQSIHLLQILGTFFILVILGV